MCVLQCYAYGGKLFVHVKNKNISKHKVLWYDDVT